ncbi:hypothetical protein [Microtetraspora malaysiensis]|uniref:Uncharacterized protein n=1 Tax=Microtetraspora malaysiensis TaxID=161358 RepID=A0ABW6SQE6_9ACTN
MDSSVKQSGAPAAWERGYTGAGVKVATLMSALPLRGQQRDRISGETAPAPAAAGRWRTGWSGVAGRLLWAPLERFVVQPFLRHLQVGTTGE